ncbi:MAG: M1 family metallopeptidase [Halioglobus sp.]
MASMKGISIVLCLIASAVLTACTDTPASGPLSQTTGSDVLPARLDTPPAGRLPMGITPKHYSLHLDIDPRQDRFSGSVDIAIELSRQTQLIWLHGLDITVNTATATLADGQTIPLKWQQATQTGVVKLTAETALPAGAANLQFTYSAPFNTNLEGLYKVNKGADAYAFTQFQATSARRVFPSFDEPAYKVSFDISLSIPEQFVAISNSPQIDESKAAPGIKTLTFATTKPLPTYLIAFAVGPLEIVEWEPIPGNELRKRSVPLRGITTAGKAQEIRYALGNTAAILEKLEEYFATPYPYAKLDIIAVPDFSAGAMENAGAITYREQLILLDETAPISQKRSFFVTHAHELAHQWFGNLVTPLWWDDIWLNESFATWNSHIILDQLYPDQMYREALQNSASGVMRIDSLASARQIREPIERHEDIGSAFNGITYQKGGGVLSMFEAFLGAEGFREGIRQYMQDFAFGNTSAEDFIGAIAKANPQVNNDDLRAAFDSYIKQPGLPVLASELQCDKSGSYVQFSQQRYLPTGSTGSTDQYWTIPVCLSAISQDQSSEQCFLMKEKTHRLTLKSESCPDAILPNAQGHGYYRWSLPPQQWNKLLKSFAMLNTGQQISVANSLSGALNNGQISLEDYLGAVPAITRSESWRVAMAPLGDIYKIKEFVATPEQRSRLESMQRDWYRSQLARLDAITHRSNDEEQFRALTISTLAQAARDPTTRSTLSADGAAYLGFGGDEKIHPQAVDANLRLTALKVASEELGKPYHALLWRHFQKADNAQLRQYLLIAMAWTPDPDNAKVVRERILSPELKDNEIIYLYRGLMARKEHRQSTWQWSKENIWAVLDRIPAWRKGQLPSQFSSFCTLEQAEDIEDFFSPIISDLESGPRSLANTLETIRLCAAFVDLHSKRNGVE